MFCSNCGKTLKSDFSTCPHCKATVGESRFEGQWSYTGAQIKTKPGEAVRLPANHTKTTYMGTKSALDQDVDARTTYRATNEQVYSYDDVEPDEELYNEDVVNPDVQEEQASGASFDEEEAVYDIADEENAYAEADQAENEEAGADQEYAYSEESVSEEAFEETKPSFDEDFEEEKAPARRIRRTKKAKEEEDAGDQAIIDQMNDDEIAELRETLEPEKKKVKKVKTRKKTEEELIDEEIMNEIRARDLDLDDDEELDNIMLKYEQSGRYAKAPQQAEDIKAEEINAAAPKKAKKAAGHKKPLLGFLKKKEENFDIDEGEEAFEEIDDENAFNLNDLPEMEETYVDENEYDDVEITDEELEGIELTEEDLEFDERRKKLSPKAITIIKYACASILVVAVLVGVIMGLSYITDKTKKAPIDGVSYDLYMSGIELMQYRASDAYSNEILSAYDGLATSMISITARISSDLDSISQMMPEEPDVNDARFLDALKAIQNSINNSITSDMLAVSDTEKTVEEKENESSARWQTVRDMVTVLSGATSNAQLDAIIKGERVEVIQQATPEPQATSTPVPYTTIAYGSEGAAVRRLQQRLADLGYLDSEIDGDFGKKTKTAIQLFQKEAGIEVTGIADVDTQIALYADNAPKKSK